MTVNKKSKQRVQTTAPVQRQLDLEHEDYPEVVNFYCLVAAGKILVTLIIAYQVLNLMGRQVLREYKQRISVDQTIRRNVLPENEPMVE